MQQRMKSVRVLLALIVLARWSGSALAGPAPPPEEASSRPDDAPEAPSSEAGGEFTTVVTGKRGPEPLFSSDRSISVVGERELGEQRPRSTPEALWDAPGTFVQQTNQGGGSPIIRGMIGPQVLLLLDGVRLSNSTHRTGPTQYLNLVDPRLIGRVEVLRGAGSLLYGSDAMGGVVHLLPHQPRDAREAPGFDGGALVSLRTATADRSQTWHTHGDLGYGGGALLGGVSVQRLGDLHGGGEVGQQLYSGYDAWYEGFNATYRFSDGALRGWTAKVAYLMGHIEDAGRTDRLDSNLSLEIYDNDDHLLYGRLGFILTPLRTQGTLTFSYQHFFERKDSFAMAKDLVTRLKSTRDEVTADTFGSDMQFITRLWESRVRLRYGGMFYRDWVAAVRLAWSEGTPWSEKADKAYPDGSGYSTYGAFLHAEGDALRSASGHIVRLGVGYRLHGMQGEAPAEGSLPAVAIDDLGHTVLASAQYLHRDWLNLAFTFSQGFRSPNLQEAVMLGDTGKFFHVPNDDLGPERADTFELLARVRLWRVTGSMAGYVTLLHDLIKRVPDSFAGNAKVGGKDVYKNINGGEGLLWGTEVQAALELGQGFSLDGHLTYTWGEERKEDGSTEPLTRIPPLFGQVSLRWDTPAAWRWRGWAELYLRGARAQDRLSAEDEADARIPAGGTPAWWTVNLRAGTWVLDGRARVTLVLENLLDKPYKYHGSGVFAPGTNAVLALEGVL